MIITQANDFVGQYHDRMPVLLNIGDMSDWLSGARGPDLLQPAANDVLKAWPVARTVNSSRAKDEPSLIREVLPGPAKPGTGTLL
jgi:putative SOS response-associated peptidase YedK